jgi:hypothetical protein
VSGTQASVLTSGRTNHAWGSIPLLSVVVYKSFYSVHRYGSGVEHLLDKQRVESSNLSVGMDILV